MIDQTWLAAATAEEARSGFASFHLDEVPGSDGATAVGILEELSLSFDHVQMWIPVGVATGLPATVDFRGHQSWESTTSEPPSVYVSRKPLERQFEETRFLHPPLPGQPNETRSFLTYLRSEIEAANGWEYSVGIWVVPLSPDDVEQTGIPTSTE